MANRRPLVLVSGAPAELPASDSMVGGYAPRLQTVTSSATITPDAAANDMVDVTALATGATFANHSNTPGDGQRLLIRIKDNGGSQTLAWGTAYASGGVTLPTATTAGKVHHIGLIWNAALSKWLCVAAVVQP